VLNLLEDLQRDLGIAYLFIAHDLAVVRHIADRVAVMYLGRIMEIGPANVVISSPRHPYTAALVSVAPSPEPPPPGERPRRTILVGETPDASAIPSGCRFRTRCPLAFDRCVTEEPPLIDLGNGHAAACWLAESGQAEALAAGVPTAAPLGDEDRESAPIVG
jgi:oligopeptide/dipeptide ABC transporter ATP-binding protein